MSPKQSAPSPDPATIDRNGVPEHVEPIGAGQVLYLAPLLEQRRQERAQRARLARQEAFARAQSFQYAEPWWVMPVGLAIGVVVVVIAFAWGG